MTISTVSIVAKTILNTPLPNGRVTFELTGLDIAAGLIAPGGISVDLDVNGVASIALLSNASGTQGTQYRVGLLNADGELQYSGLATVPATNCYLHDILSLVPPPTVDDATAAKLAAQTYASQAGTSAAAAAADRAQTDIDAQAAAADRAQADIDAQATGADRAAASASASLALAVFGTTADLNAAQQIMLGYANTAGAQAQLAAGFAASASSVVQQDLSGVSAQALHRSPNAIAALFVYDTSKDSDGGAWVDRCAHTSWMNEALNGTWLQGPASGFASEIDARDWLGAQGQTSLVTGDSSNFAGGVGAWVAGGNTTISSVNGSMRVTATAASPVAYVAVTTVANQRYRIELSFKTATAGKNSFYGAGTVAGSNNIAGVTLTPSLAGTRVTLSFVATGTTTYINFGGSGTYIAGDYTEFDDVLVRPVSYATNPSGAYYQSAADGKFYRLWKNLYRDSTNFASSNWVATNVTVTPDAAVAPDGTTTADLMVLNNGLAGGNIVCAGAIVTLVAGVTYTQTTEVKPNGTKTAFTLLSGAALYLDGLARSFVYTLSGAGSVALAAGGSATGASTTITALANGWYRCTLTFTPTVSGNVAMQHRDGVTGDGVNGFYLGHTQVEVGPTWTGNEIKAADGPQTETFTGNTAKFPRLAAFVAEASNWSIYDLTQPGRPMWRRFAALTGSATKSEYLPNTATITGITALNGRVSYTGSGGNVYLSVVDFLMDRGWRYNTAGSSGFRFDSIARRQVVPAVAVIEPTATGIASLVCNAVTMTVLPDAPLDAATGLPVPTIALGTAGGMSVLKHDGSVVNSASVASFSFVDITPQFIAAKATSSNMSVVLNPGTLGAGFATTTIAQGAAPSFAGDGARYSTANLSRVAHRGLWLMGQPPVANAGNGARIGGLRLNEGAPSSSLAFGITSDHNTGWMTGDIRRCWLSSNVAETNTDANLVTNGTFNADISGWTSYNGGSSTGAATWDASGAMLCTPSATALGGGYQDLTLVPGKTYRITGRSSGPSVNLIVYPGISFSGGTLSANDGSNNYSLVFTAVAVTQRIMGYVVGNGTPGTIDNISVQEVVADRSYKNRPLTVYGTIAKSAVAAAAQLMFYSGWSATNYLQEPYSADLDFGTGAWSVSAWVNYTAAAVSTIFERAAATGAYIKLGTDAAGKLTATAYDGTTTRTVTSAAAYNTTTSVKVRVEYATSGTLTLKVNGAAVASTTGAPLLTLNNASAVTTIGNDRTLATAFVGSIALVKPGATLPTAEQSAFMYAQEQFMFQPGAQCCLPDAGGVDFDFDAMQDRIKVISAANESSWTGLVRTSSAAVSVGAFTKAAHRSGVKLLARSTTAPGVDVTIPAYGLREELVNRAERAAALARLQQTFDFDAITAQTDFTLPVGYTAIEVLSAGASKREGATKDYTRLFDGFRETIRFAVAPGNAAWVQIIARRAP